MTIERYRMTDENGNSFDIGRIGVTFPMELVRTSNPLDLIDASILESARLMRMQTLAMGQMVTGERSLDEIQGPIRMAKMTGEQLLIGLPALAAFAAFISIAIAFMNLLPIPGLDGGYLALYAVESIMRRDASMKTVNRTMKGGYAIISLLMIFAFTNDIRILAS